MNKKISVQTTIILLVLVAILSGGVVYLKTSSEFQNKVSTLDEAVLPKTSNTTSPAVNDTLAKPTSERQIGYITKVYDKNGKRFLDIDYIQWLTGKEATKAMLNDGACKGWEDTCGPTNGYYIRNQNTKIRALEISPNVLVAVDTLSHRPDGNFNFGEAISYETFKNLFAENSNSDLKSAPYWINITNGIVDKVSQQYQP